MILHQPDRGETLDPVSPVGLGVPVVRGDGLWGPFDL